MTPSVDTDQAATALAEFWKGRYKRQHRLLAAMTSLLSKYGSTVNSDELHRTFLLTLMGHFAVGDAALYVPSPDGRRLEAVLGYGSIPLSRLPVLPLDDPFITGYAERRAAGPVRPRAEDAHAASPAVALAGIYEVLAPLHLANKLVGMVFLGPRLNGQPYLDFDMTVLDSLAAVSATTFNNALLYSNARLSAEELKKLLEVRADVISRISHEFRTPLTVLRAGIETLPETENGPQKWMADSLERLDQLIESLLALSQGRSAGTAEAQTDPLTAVHEAVGNIGPAAAEKNIRLTVASSNTARVAAARVSAGALKIMLNALLDNALAYSPAGSSVTVEVDCVAGSCDPERDGIRFPEWIASTRTMIAEFAELSDSLESLRPAQDAIDADTVDADPSRRYIVIRVTDEGIGIPADEIPLVAEPFRQASNCPDRGVKGKGLGLALAQRSAVASGGFLCCRSSLGSGTTVSVFLPAH